jgi:hypothetical protein
MKEHKIIRQTINAPGGVRTMSWLDDGIIDWALGGMFYGLNGDTSQIGQYHFAFDFDRSITSQDGQYAFIYQNRGTKGLLLKNGGTLREINRPYYHAGTYEYPAAFYTSPDGITYLIHCPIEYCRLDFEEVESGKIVTDIPEREPVDIFHSRLEISPDNKSLMVRGWVWHPLDVVHVYDIEACLHDPMLLDKHMIYLANSAGESGIGAFVTNDQILIESLNNEDEEADKTNYQLAVWDFKKQSIINRLRVSGIFGNIVAIQDNLAWDLFQYPKLIDLQTGEIIDKLEMLATGTQTSSIIHHLNQVPNIIYNRKLNKVAVKTASNSNHPDFYDQLEILSIK